MTSPTSSKRPRSLIALLDRLAEGARAKCDSDRRENPHRFTNSPDGLGPSFLFVDNAARMLGCNVDHVRRIPRQALPASKVGARLIYARADVEAYIRSKRDAGAARHVSSRKLQRVVTMLAADKAPAQPEFDPVAYVRRAKAPA